MPGYPCEHYHVRRQHLTCGTEVLHVSCCLCLDYLLTGTYNCISTPFLTGAGKAGQAESKAHTGGIATQKQEASQHPEVESTLRSYRLHTPIEALVYFSFTREKKDKFSSKFLKLNSNRCPGS